MHRGRTDVHEPSNWCIALRLCTLLIAGEVFFDDGEEFGAGGDAGDVGAEEASAVFALGVVAAEFSHQQGAFLLAETSADKVVVPEHAAFLLFECWLRWNQLAAKSGGCLLK